MISRYKKNKGIIRDYEKWDHIEVMVPVYSFDKKIRTKCIITDVFHDTVEVSTVSNRYNIFKINKRNIVGFWNAIDEKDCGGWCKKHSK